MLDQLIACIAFFVLLLYGCADPKTKPQEPETLVEIVEPELIQEATTDSILSPVCECLKQDKIRRAYKMEERLDIPPALEEDSLEMWVSQWLLAGNDPLQIKEMDLYGSDLETQALHPFRQVEKLTIMFPGPGTCLFNQLSFFPNLKHLELNEGWVEICLGEVVPPQLETITLRKSILKGETHSDWMLGIRELNLWFGKFGEDTLDLTEAKCLESLSIVGNRNKYIDLGQLNMKKMKCFRKLIIQNTFGNVHGFPQHIDLIDWERLSIVGLNMTDKEKEMYDHARLNLRTQK